MGDVAWKNRVIFMGGGGDLKILWRGWGNKKGEGQADISLNKE